MPFNTSSSSPLELALLSHSPLLLLCLPVGWEPPSGSFLHPSIFFYFLPLFLFLEILDSFFKNPVPIHSSTSFTSKAAADGGVLLTYWLSPLEMRISEVLNSEECFASHLHGSEAAQLKETQVCYSLLTWPWTISSLLHISVMSLVIYILHEPKKVIFLMEKKKTRQKSENETFCFQTLRSIIHPSPSSSP